MALEQDQVVAALRTVRDPELHKDIVTLGMVKGLNVHENAVAVRIELPMASGPARDGIEREVKGALTRLGASDVHVEIAIARGAAPGQQGVAAAGPGVRLQEFHPFWPWEGKFSWRPINRDHRKLLVIDDDLAGLGGLNLAGEYAGSWVVKNSDIQPCDFWRDNAIGIKGPGAQRFLQSFAKTWYYVTRRGKIRTAEFVYNLDGVCGPCAWPVVYRRKRGTIVRGEEPDRPGQLGVLASAPTVHSPLRPFLNKLFREATRSIYLTMAYFAPHDDLIDELCAAARRGVRVRLMLPGRCDVKALVVAARSFYETLMAAGVEIYERQGVILHAKTMVIDGLVSMIGSTNLDYRSIEYNLELSALIRSRDFGRQMETLFDNDVNFAKHMSPGKWKRRPMTDRFIQWAVSRARYLL